MVNAASPKFSEGRNLRSLSNSSLAMISMSENRISAGSSWGLADHQRHGGEAPSDHRVDGEGALNCSPPVRWADKLDLAIRLQNPTPILNAPTKAVPVQDLFHLPGRGDWQGSQQEPFQRHDVVWRLRLVDVHQVSAAPGASSRKTMALTFERKFLDLPGIPIRL